MGECSLIRICSLIRSNTVFVFYSGSQLEIFASVNIKVDRRRVIVTGSVMIAFHILVQPVRNGTDRRK